MPLPTYDYELRCLRFGELQTSEHFEGGRCRSGEPTNMITLSSEEAIDLTGGVWWSREAWIDFLEWLVRHMKGYQAMRDTLCRVNTGKGCEDQDERP